ncbi:hypothetical protein [Sneathiella glossodoripedis]|uniref:hypothetical protein n=1 Tax=Sneathiella glossodoripedis TaxID=418853 RepID=UPI00047272B0|nr:hypothetical protein [Sneathiella glossodoripedis]
MRQFSADTTGFAALTIVEILLQELIRQEILDDRDVKRILKSAARRHEKSATGSPAKIDLNMETATLIRQMTMGLKPLFKEAKKRRKSKA